MNLQCNILSKQIEVENAHDVRMPIYTTVQWDRYTAQTPPQLPADSGSAPNSAVAGA